MNVVSHFRRTLQSWFKAFTERVSKWLEFESNKHLNLSVKTMSIHWQELVEVC